MIVPVAARLGVPIAAPLDSYPRLPYRGEDVRAVVDRCDCACGGVVVLLAGQDRGRAAGIHAASPEHLAWRDRRGW